MLQVCNGMTACCFCSAQCCTVLPFAVLASWYRAGLNKLVVQDDEIDFAEQQKTNSIQHKQQYEHDFAEKQRLQKMQQDHGQFQQQIMSRRQGEFEELQVTLVCCHQASQL